jgi:outer membrane protein assembly factor BamB
VGFDKVLDMADLESVDLTHEFDGRLYGIEIAKFPTRSTRVICLSIQTGDRLWATELSGATALTPARVVGVTQDGVFVVVSTSTGETLIRMQRVSGAIETSRGLQAGEWVFGIGGRGILLTQANSGKTLRRLRPSDLGAIWTVQYGGTTTVTGVVFGPSGEIITAEAEYPVGFPGLTTTRGVRRNAFDGSVMWNSGLNRPAQESRFIASPYRTPNGLIAWYVERSSGTVIREIRYQNGSTGQMIRTVVVPWGAKPDALGFDAKGNPLAVTRLDASTDVHAGYVLRRFSQQTGNLLAHRIWRSPDAGCALLPSGNVLKIQWGIGESINGLDLRPIHETDVTWSPAPYDAPNVHAIAGGVLLSVRAGMTSGFARMNQAGVTVWRRQVRHDDGFAPAMAIGTPDGGAYLRGYPSSQLIRVRPTGAIGFTRVIGDVQNPMMFMRPIDLDLVVATEPTSPRAARPRNIRRVAWDTGRLRWTYSEDSRLPILKDVLVADGGVILVAENRLTLLNGLTGVHVWTITVPSSNQMLKVFPQDGSLFVIEESGENTLIRKLDLATGSQLVSVNLSDLQLTRNKRTPMRFHDLGSRLALSGVYHQTSGGLVPVVAALDPASLVKLWEASFSDVTERVFDVQTVFGDHEACFVGGQFLNRPLTGPITNEHPRTVWTLAKFSAVTGSQAWRTTYATADGFNQVFGGFMARDGNPVFAGCEALPGQPRHWNQMVTIKFRR